MSERKLYLLGAPRIEATNAPVVLDTRKALALVAYLAVTDQPHTRDALAALLWPESDGGRARSALRRTLSSLRAALDDRWLDADRETVRLDKDADLWVDVDAFFAHLAQTETHDHPPGEVCPLCLAPLAEAVALYTGDFLAGFGLPDSPNFDDWHFFQAETLRRAYVGALQRLVEGHARRGDLDAAIAYARRWLAADPLHEPAHRQLMRLYAQNNQRAAALRQYRECVRILEAELGVPPLDETVQLYETIQANQGGIWIPPQADPQPASTPAAVDSGSPRRLPLVGRLPAWSHLLNGYRSSTQRGQFLVIEGEAGIGKTRLAEEFLDYAVAGGAPILRARCYAEESELAYAPFVEALRAAVRHADADALLSALSPPQRIEAARLLPEIALRDSASPQPAVLDGPGARIRFFQAIADLLAALLVSSPPGVLFLDDVQWLDPASQDLLLYLVRRLADHPLCLIVTWRSTDVPTIHPLRRLLAEAQRTRNGSSILLDRLDEEDVATLVAALGKEMALPAHAAHTLYAESEGLPFYLAERLALGDQRSLETQKAPESVQMLYQSRLANISQAARQLLTAAAVIGRSFDYEILQEVSGRSEEETVEGLDELLAHGLIREQATPADLRYDFSHETLRSLIYTEASLARRRLLHRRVAGALSSGRHWQQMSAQIAHHLQQAGQEAEAALAYADAGEQAQAVYANTEALSHFRTALALGHPRPADLYEAVGDLETLAGNYKRAIRAYEQSLASGTETALAAARRERKIGEVYHRVGDWILATEHFAAGLAALAGAPAAGEEARLLSAWSLTALQQGDAARAAEHAEQARVRAQASADAREMAQVENILGLIARCSHDLARAQHHLSQSLHWAQTLGDLGAQVAALNNLALVHAAQDETERAMELVQQALSLCRTHGDRHREAALLNHLADLLHSAGRADESMVYLKQAVAIFAEIGEELSDPQLEIWKLVAW